MFAEKCPLKTSQTFSVNKNVCYFLKSLKPNDLGANICVFVKPKIALYASYTFNLSFDTLIN